MFAVLGKITGNSKEKTIPTHADNKVVAEEMAGFYTHKIVAIREQIKAEKIPHSKNIKSSKLLTKTNEEFDSFRPISSEELINIISSMKNKTCRLDPIPTSVVKKCVSLLQFILLNIINLSLRQNVYPDILKNALVTPIIKDENKNSDDYKNYRPVSNLKFLAKLLENVMYIQINEHIESQSLYPNFQSAYRKFHSCETALIQVVDDIQVMLSNNLHVAMVLLDSSSAFDTIDHGLMFTRLQEQFSITNGGLAMIKSYLTNRNFSVIIGEQISNPKELKYGVPQGSILGPMFYLLYTTEIESIVRSHGMQIHVYADDCKVYFSYKPEDKREAEERLGTCITALKTWMSANFLKLNSDKTVVKIFKPERQSSDLTVGTFSLTDIDARIQPSETIKVLGVMFGKRMNFKEFASRKIQICNLQLRNLWAVRKCLPTETRILLVTNLIISSLDYCNSLLICSPKYVIIMLQKALNKAIRFIFNIRREEHITPYLFKLHILPVSFRIRYKINLIAYKVLQKISPVYLIEKMKIFCPTTTAHLRPGHGRDHLTFDITLNQVKVGNLISRIISEWNKLPLNLRKIEEITIFKTHLKTHLFKEAFAKLL